MIVDASLGKGQCNSCGVVQRLTTELLGQGTFYTQNYHTYFSRVGAETFDRSRYAATAMWMKSSLGKFCPQNIADVGCGRGWTMKEMSLLFPDTPITGIEPSEEDARLASENGFDIITSTLEAAMSTVGTFDLIYCNNVIQHSLSPRKFLSNLMQIVSDNGLIVLTCPDVTRPSNEMMWSDQNFSLAPVHLFKLASDVGLHVLSWQMPPSLVNLANKQLIIASKDSRIPFTFCSGDPPSFSISENIEERNQYLEGWQSLDNYLCQSVSDKTAVYNFGASMWSYLLRGYCPKYWQKVDACVIDEFSGQFMDKAVMPYQGIEFTRKDAVVLGTEPLNQPSLEQTLRDRCLAASIITWNQIVPQ